MSSEQQIREALRGLADNAGHTPTVRVHAASNRGRRRSASSGVAAAMLVLVVAGVVGLAFLGQDEQPAVTTDANRPPTSGLAASPDATVSMAPPAPACSHGVASAKATSVGEIVEKALSDRFQAGSDGVPPGLDQGVVGWFVTSGGGVTVVADPAVTDLASLRDSLTSGLSASDASLVTVQPSCTSSAALAAAWRKVVARNWASNAGSIAFGLSLDPSTEQVVIETDVSAAGPKTIDALTHLAPGLITIQDGAAGRA